MAFNHFYTVTRFCMVLIVSHTLYMYSRFTSCVTHLTSVSCGDEGWVFISVRRRAWDGSCGRVTSVSVLFSGLHESEQFGCVVAVLCIGNCSRYRAVECFYTPMLLSPAPCKDIVVSMSLFYTIVCVFKSAAKCVYSTTSIILPNLFVLSTFSLPFIQSLVVPKYSQYYSTDL